MALRLLPMHASSATSVRGNSSIFGSREAPAESATASSGVLSAWVRTPPTTSCRSSSRLHGLFRSGTGTDRICASALAQQIFLQERNRGIELKIRVRFLLVAVPFVARHHVPYRRSLLLQGRDNLV